MRILRPLGFLCGFVFVLAIVAIPAHMRGALHVSLSAPSSPPVAVDDAFAVHGDTQLADLLANDFDPDGHLFVFDGYGTLPQHGNLSQNPQRPRYAPNRGFVGSDSFTYRICDVTGACSTYATVTLTVSNAAPTPSDDAFTVHGTTLMSDVLANDTDPDGDLIVFDSLQTVPLHGSFQNTNYQIPFYAPHAGYTGTDSFTYRVCDLLGLCADATVTLNVVNNPPTPKADSFRVHGLTFLGNLLANDTDPDGDLMAFDSIQTFPQHGTFQNSNFQIPVYAPTYGYSGSDSFTYRICDVLSACATTTVTLYVVGDGENDGGASCNARLGRPINVTNGNMYLQQSDYQLPGPGYGIKVTRTYNSNSQQIGLFGRGWSTTYDEAIGPFDANLARFNQADGRAIYLGRPVGASDPYLPVVEDFHGQLAQNGSLYTLTMKDGSTRQFSSAGKLASLTDRNGNTTTLSYGARGFLTSVTDPFGRVLTFTTNDNGQVLTSDDAKGTVATYSYGPNNQLLSVIYADNSAHKFTYDGALRLLSVEDALGNTLESHTYDSSGRALTSETHGGVEHYSFAYLSESETDVTDGLGRVSKYFFDKSTGRNVVTRVEGLCSCGSGSQVQTWTYDGNLNVTSTTNSLNQLITHTYDAQGNELTMTDPAGTTTRTYNQFGQLLTLTDALGATTTFTYDVQGTPLSITDARNHTTNYTNNALGQLLSVTNARGKTTSYAYDNSGNLISTTNALGHTSQLSYDERARLTSATNALGHTTSFSYDAVGRLAQIIHPDGSTIGFEYDLAGRRTAVTDAKGNRSTYAYDNAYRLLSQSNALGEATAFGYDAMSNLISVTDPLSRVTNYEYDEFNRPVKTIYPAAAPGAARLSESTSYDALGNIKQRLDTAGRLNGFLYDDSNRLIQTTDADSKTTAFEYDPVGRMTALVDALGQRYRFNYDSLGRLRHVRRGNEVMTFGYDAVGNRRRRIDYNGALTVYRYDALNRLKTITYPDTTTVSYNYDKLSRLQTATNEHGTVDLDYNKLNRLTGMTDVFGQEINYNYDPNGNRTKLSLNATVIATYRYDTVDRLTRLLDSNGAVFTFDYDAASRLTQQKAPNGVKSNFQYDGIDRLTRLLDTKGASTIGDHQYQYNAASQITQITEPTTARNYAYDALDRLVSASYTNAAQPNENYAYDAVGNRTASHLSATYAYQPFNRLSNTSTTNYTYDSNGNLISKSDASGTTQYLWDFENRLTRVTLPNGNTISYKYDSLGRRIQRVPGAGVATNFIYDGQDVIRDLNSDGSTVNYLNGPGIDNKLRLTDSRLAAIGPLYFLQNHLGSTTKLTNSQGGVVEQDSYDSFGNSSGSPRTRYDYTGRERDPDTGLMYYRARWYDPQAGRFISEDPIGLAGGINQYAYVGNNPQNGTDPSGLYEIDVHYYLTYFLAMKTGCFTSSEAQLIADADQSTDENSTTSPGLGLTEQQRKQNRENHDLQPGNHEGQVSPELWRQAMNGRTNYVALGQYLHFLQDSFSHAAFESDVSGHLKGLHYYDKTDSDVPRALRMAGATWSALNQYAKEKKCGCQGKWDASWWQQVIDFSWSPGANVGALEAIDSNGELENLGMTNAAGYLDRKIRILRLRRR